MGNCYKKQRRPTSVLRLNQTRDLSVDTDDGLPYVLVFNNTQSAANERRRGQSRGIFKHYQIVHLKILIQFW